MLRHPLDKVRQTRTSTAILSKPPLTAINPLQNGNIAFNKHRREDVHATYYSTNSIERNWTSFANCFAIQIYSHLFFHKAIMKGTRKDRDMSNNEAVILKLSKIKNE